MWFHPDGYLDYMVPAPPLDDLQPPAVPLTLDGHSIEGMLSPAGCLKRLYIENIDGGHLNVNSGHSFCSFDHDYTTFRESVALQHFGLNVRVGTLSESSLVLRIHFTSKRKASQADAGAANTTAFTLLNGTSRLPAVEKSKPSRCSMPPLGGHTSNRSREWKGIINVKHLVVCPADEWLTNMMVLRLLSYKSLARNPLYVVSPGVVSILVAVAHENILKNQDRTGHGEWVFLLIKGMGIWISTRSHNTEQLSRPSKKLQASSSELFLHFSASTVATGSDSNTGNIYWGGRGSGASLDAGLVNP
ncbi:hypothetical protein ARMGADRAFT_1035963 [Armillaria gallica]|uniref:Uncharacterized protein n=1 Tax=Armillaria gallica TaxID=47427 RepID=A0A2H3DES6_ARMGA|nr:hypothetical protein ARMGADRAFT_1035963 [Armillaria gallica]